MSETDYLIFTPAKAYPSSIHSNPLDKPENHYHRSLHIPDNQLPITQFCVYPISLMCRIGLAYFFVTNKPIELPNMRVIYYT